MSWEQAMPGGRELRTIEMPCPNGCSGDWRHPHAQRDRVVELPDERPATRVPGNVEASQRIGAEFIASALEKWGFIGDSAPGRRDTP